MRSQLSMSNTNGKMAIVGDGTERQKLEELTKELKISRSS